MLFDNLLDSNGDLALWNTCNSEMKGRFNLFPSNITELQWFLDAQILASHQNYFGLFDLEKVTYSSFFLKFHYFFCHSKQKSKGLKDIPI